MSNRFLIAEIQRKARMSSQPSIGQNVLKEMEVRKIADEAAKKKELEDIIIAEKRQKEFAEAMKLFPIPEFKGKAKKIVNVAGQQKKKEVKGIANPNWAKNPEYDRILTKEEIFA